MKRFIAINLFLLLISFNIFAAPKFEHDKFQYQTGQIIAISETNYDASTFFFEAFTGSRYGHIGIIVVEDGEVVVYEANPPFTQKNSIEDFLKRSRDEKGDFQATVLKVIPALSESELKNLVVRSKGFS